MCVNELFPCPQSGSGQRGVPAGAEAGSVPAGEGSRPEGGRQSAGLRLESAQEVQSKENYRMSGPLQVIVELL